MAETLVGDIIEIEHTDDHSASTPTWNKVGKTKDTVEIAPETEVADVRHHEDFQRDKTATSEAWEISFAADIVTGTAQLETIDLIDTSTYELKGYADSRETGNTADAITITVYDNEADQADNTVKHEVGTTDYVIIADSGEMAVEDYSTREFVIYSRERPVRLDAGGSL
ncbi:hypothetical protein [Haloarcula sp. 1CSR25-25]|uniref:hypothetical protein n=1 Tax=Haloarcula sp. 1CSR25-25 TaxID=2862545 RepID=UPI002894542E|nr:hypothetical protein [Haloarcula sp. 1CSR25-25]MDT3434687.1 hypothetical protein [Haloarcula sp. 1CSR25-25]